MLNTVCGVMAKREAAVSLFHKVHSYPSPSSPFVLLLSNPFYQMDSCIFTLFFFLL